MAKDKQAAQDSSHRGAAVSAAGLVTSEKGSSFLDTLAPKVRKRVEYLNVLQNKYDELKEQFTEERTALQDKYQKLYDPLFTERCGVVTGTIEVDGNVVEGQSDEIDKETEEKGVPNFWLIAMKKNSFLDLEIIEQDEEVLKYLQDIRYCRLDDVKGFQLIFTFEPNPFFKNDILTKKYYVTDEEDLAVESFGTTIEWFSGKSITKDKMNESFFKFFNPPEIPYEDIDYDTDEEYEQLLDLDYDVGCIIRDAIIPEAVSWYTVEPIDEYSEANKKDTKKDDVFRRMLTRKRKA